MARRYKQVNPENAGPSDSALLISWIHNPEKFVREVIGIDPTWQQVEACGLVGKMVIAKMKASAGEKMTAEEKKLSKKFGVSIRSGRGTGKDAWVAWMIMWLMICFPYFKGMCTAPTSHQLNDVLWAEIGKWIRFSQQRNPLNKSILSENIVWQSDKIYLKGEQKEWFTTARTANVKGSADEQAETLSGLHAEYMALVVDEASGVPDPVFKPIESTLTGKMNFAILISQMSRNSGYFYQTHYGDRENWSSLRWNAEDSPLVSRESIERIAHKYGKDSDYYKVNVLGDPPECSSDTLIPLPWVEAATDKDMQAPEDSPLFFGVDVARHGDDKSIIMKRRSNVIEGIEEFAKINTMELVGWVSLLMSEENPVAVGVDTIGVGGGVYDRLQEMGKHNVYAINVAEAPTDPKKFYQLRDELWWKVRRMFEEGTIKIPKDDELIGELSSIRFGVGSDGRTKVESKYDMKKRGLSSPNKADALCLAYYWNETQFLDPPETKRRRYQPEERPLEHSWMAV